ncbi:DNRLRE domain-containing protein [Nonomuraea sp. NPDC052129]|uniref:DNRLRE domain-containing protein n=1 Tax=Nonomuraea sp. NPDC052129 TaxID=3154651 RepID=UPI003413FFFE
MVEENGVLRPKVAKAATEFSTGGSNKPLVTFSPQTKQSVSLNWPTTLPRPTIVGNRATYADAAGSGADLVLTALPTGYRQEIVLRTKRSKPLEISMPVITQNLKLRTGKDGRLELADASGHSLAHALNSSAFATLQEGKQATLLSPVPGKVKTTLTGDSAQKSLVITPDASFLNDPATKYPVTIDSAVTMSLDGDIDVADDGAMGDPTRPLLTAGAIFGILNRTYLRFNVNALIGQDIVDAKLSLLNTDAPACGNGIGDGIQVRRVTSAWHNENLTWANKPSSTDEGAQTVTKAYSSDCGPGQLDWPITAIAKNWAEGGGNYGLELRTPDESSQDDNWRVLASSEYSGSPTPPKLTVTYQGYGGPTVVNPAGSDGVEVFTAPESWRRDSLPMSSTLGHALDAAEDRADANSSALGVPLVDMATGAVHIPAVTPEGQTIAAQAISGTAYNYDAGVDLTLPGGVTDSNEADTDGDGIPGAAENYAFNPSVETVPNSSAKLNAIADEILNIDGQIADGDKLLESSIWPARNQVMVEASEVSPALRLALAQRYGTTTVSIWLRPGATRDHVNTRSRIQDDALPSCPVLSTGKVSDCRSRDGYDDDDYINGGSIYGTSDGAHACSTGFAWKTSTTKYILTAGHCNPVDVAGKPTIGEVVGSTFNSKSGSVIRTGQKKPYGDLSLIDASTISKIPTASIFYGRGITDATAEDPPGAFKRGIYGRYTQRAKVGDRYCTGGAMEGEICGYVVQIAHKRKEMRDEETGSTFFIDPLTTGSKSGKCSDSGDSGGPVYTIIYGGQGEGGAIAKGIISGGNDVLNCKQSFTDLFDARATFGGDILKRKRS